MTIIEIQALDNGAHRNQTGSFTTIPEGWAVIPDNMAIPAIFPFVDITARDGEVTSMTANQEAYDAAQAAASEAEAEPSEEDDTAAMLVDHEYRLTLLELGLTE